MNKARRKEIAEANDLISKAISILSDARSQLEQISADEQEYFAAPFAGSSAVTGLRPLVEIVLAATVRKVADVRIAT